MEMNLATIEIGSLKRAIVIRERIDVLQRELEGIIGTRAAAVFAGTGKRHTMSAAGRARVAAAQRARWAKLKGAERSSSTKRRRVMSPAARAKIAAAAKKRWAKAKAAGKKSL